MRIFLPSVPARRLEYFLMMVVTTIAGYVATNFYLQLAVDVDTREVSYIARNLPTYSLILAVILAIQIIASMRRLNDLGKPTGAAFLVLLPISARCSRSGSRSRSDRRPLGTPRTATTHSTRSHGSTPIKEPHNSTRGALAAVSC